MPVHVPLGRNFRTRTTTRTFPPPAVGDMTSWRPIRDTPSRARREGLEAVDRRVAAEADVEITLGDVMPVRAEDSDEVADEIEPGPAWPMWW